MLLESVNYHCTVYSSSLLQNTKAQANLLKKLIKKKVRETETWVLQAMCALKHNPENV